jgi:hypothetical protein
LLLALQLDVARPFNKSIQVGGSLGAQGTSDSKNLGTRLEQRVLLGLLVTSLSGRLGDSLLVGGLGLNLLSGLREKKTI